MMKRTQEELSKVLRPIFKKESQVQLPKLKLFTKSPLMSCLD